MGGVNQDMLLYECGNLARRAIYINNIIDPIRYLTETGAVHDTWRGLCDRV